ncbi:hypothetical protein CCUS01_06572 [Colletotrichum cuscutae]|uniref:Uncharacterized protein n=1 Tax=Colletotrichum cuscutae TaxID=1209917 RepID=A0AAI9V649_9PEZI|nr:hypothetical protein CCUS01_06572 [Colletotrichum cuscutae]
MLPVIDVQFATDSQSAQSRQKKAREILNHLRSHLGDDIYFLCILALQITPLSAVQPETFYNKLSEWLNKHHIPSAFTEMAQARVHNFLQKKTDSVQEEQGHRKRQSSSLHPEETPLKRRKQCSEEIAANLEIMSNDLTGSIMQSGSMILGPGTDRVQAATETSSSDGQRQRRVIHDDVVDDDVDGNTMIGRTDVHQPTDLLPTLEGPSHDIETLMTGWPTYSIDAMDAIRGLTQVDCKVWLSMPIMSGLESVPPKPYVIFTVPYPSAFEILKRNDQVLH